MSSNTVAGDLVRAFGKPDKMAELYAPGIRWSMPASTPFPRPIEGREAVVAFNRKVWTEVHSPDCEVEILDELGDGSSSAVRFIYRAFVFEKDGIYQNEYTVFVRSGRDGIEEVFEAFDTVTTLDFFRGGQTAMRGFDK